MSRLRRHLERARSGYREVRYPGDLADELLPAPASRRLLKIGGISAAGIAAAVAMILWLHQPADPTPEPVVRPVPAPQMAERPAPGPLTLPTMPELPRDLTRLPSHQPLTIPAMPSMPSLDLTDEPSEPPYYEEI